MKKMITIIALLVSLVLTLQLSAQPGSKQGRPDGPPQDKVEKLTDTQIAQIKTILSDYDADSITAEDAKAIHEAFRKEGLRGGKAVDEVIEEAGFDTKKLRELAPPPEMKQGEMGKPEHSNPSEG